MTLLREFPYPCPQPALNQCADEGSLPSSAIFVKEGLCNPMILFDKLAYSSPIRTKSPALKSVFSTGSLVLCVTFRQPVVCLLVFLMMAAATLRFACLSPSRFLRLLLGPAIFLTLSSIAILFVLSDTPPQLLAVPVFSRYLGISLSSFSHWAQLMAVAFSSVACLYFLILTTPITDLLTVLRRLHCPWLLLELMLLIYRSIFVLLDIADAIQTSQNCRLGNRSFRSRLSCMGQMLSVLLVRSLKRSSLLYDAMESRLYDGQIRVLEESSPARAEEWTLCLGWLGLCTFLSLFLL